MLVDEGDVALLDKKMLHDKKVANRGFGFLIALTATPFRAAKGPEQKYLDKRHFGYYNSLFPAFVMTTAKEIELHDFLKREVNGQIPHRLIYCTDLQMADQREKISGIVWVNMSDLEKVSRLDKFGEPVTLFVTNEHLMRGVDYRSPERGIELLLCRDFQHERDVSQAMGRVGRYLDYGERFKLPKLALIDEKKKAELVGYWLNNWKQKPRWLIWLRKILRPLFFKWSRWEKLPW